MHHIIYILFLLMAHNIYAQETDVQRSGLKGPVKLYRYKHFESGLDNYPMKYEKTSTESKVFNEKREIVADINSTVLITYDKEGLPQTDYDHTAWEFVSRSGRFVPRKGYSLDSKKDTIDRMNGYYEYDDNDRLIRVRNSWAGKKDSLHSIEEYTYYPDGRLDSSRTLILLKKGEILSFSLTKRTYGTNTDTFFFILKEKVFSMNVSIRDSEGRKKEEATWLKGKVSGVEYYFYSDGKTEPAYTTKTHPSATQYTDYMYFTIWNRDAYGNYLRKKGHKKDFIHDEEWEIEYYK